MSGGHLLLNDADMLSDTENIQLFTAECLNGKLLLAL